MTQIDRRHWLAAGTAVALAPILASCSAKAEGAERAHQAATSRPADGRVVMIIRHAEKPSGALRGVTVDGLQDPESLAVPGWSRAGALLTLFAPVGAGGAAAPVRSGLLRPTTLIASNPRDTGSKRPLQTVTPLAAKLGVTVNVDHAKGQEAKLVKGLTALAGPVLIAWQHESISAIVDHLGQVLPPPPSTWPDSRYDVVFVFTRSGNHWVFTQIPQLLMAGDSAQPIS